MFDSALPKDRGPIHNIITNPNRIFYRDPQYSISSRPINQHTLPSPLMLDSRIVNNSKFQDGFIVATNKSTASKAYHIDPKYRTRPLNQYALPPPNMKRVNFLTMNSAKTDTTTDLKQKPTFQLYVQIIRQIYKRMADDITASDQTVLNNAFESFQKEYVNKKNNMNDVQLDSMINNFISRVKEVFMRWYDTSDKSFNPVLTLESGTVLEEITTNNDELIETLKNKEILEENLKEAEVEAEVIALQEASDILEAEKKANEEIVQKKIDDDAKNVDIERQNASDIQDIINAKNKDLQVADDLIATDIKLKTSLEDKNKAIIVEETLIRKEITKTSSISDVKIRKAAMDDLDDKTMKLNKEKKDIIDDLSALSAKTTKITAARKALEKEVKNKTKELDDKNNAIIAKISTDAKDVKSLVADTEKENKTLDKDFEKKKAYVLKGLVNLEKDRTIKKVLKEKIVVIKDFMPDTRLKEVYDIMPKEFRDPENKEFELKYREAVRKVFLDKDNITVANDPRRLVYKNNYERFKTLARDKLIPANLYSDIYDNIGGTVFNDVLDVKKISSEYKKLTGSDPKRGEINDFQRYAINRFATPKKVPTKSSIVTRGKAKSKVP